MRKPKIFTEFEKSKVVVKTVYELITNAEASGGSIMIADDNGQIWKFEKMGKSL